MKRIVNICAPRPLAPVVAAFVVASALCSCAADPNAAAAQAPEPPPAAETPAMSSDFSSNALLVADVQRRLVAMLPSQGTFAVLVELGAGATAKQAKADLVASLRGESRIAWSQMTSRPDGPLPDAANPGGHVNAVQYRIEPAPQLVLLVNEREGRLQMAARDPGPDPLGPATDGWLWILIGP